MRRYWRPGSTRDGYLRKEIASADSPDDLLAALRPVLGELERAYGDLAERLVDHGYELRAMEDFQPGDEAKPLAFLRWDVHAHDTLAALGAIDVSRRLGVPATFYLTWRFSPREDDVEDLFVYLRHYRGSRVSFGLHAAPVSTWFVRDYFSGNTRQARVFCETPEMKRVIDNWSREYYEHGLEGQQLAELIAGGERYHDEISASFLEAFPDARTISGHGNFLTTAAIRLQESEPTDIHPITQLLHPVAFLTEARVRRAGFDQEVTWPGNDESETARMLFDGQPAGVLSQTLRERLETGRSVGVLMHPDVWAKGKFSGVFAKVGPAVGVPGIDLSDDLAEMVFISGFARGGTTWLRKCVGSHPDMTEIPREINFNRERSNGWVHDRRLGLDRVRKILLERIAEDRLEGSRYVTKGPVNSLVVDEMSRMLPGAKFLFIVRDPRDVYNSHRRGNQEWMKGANSTIEGCLKKCERYYDGYLKARQNPNVMVVSYERLHQDPIDEYTRVCGFLGLRADADIVGDSMRRNSFQLMTGRDHDEDPDKGARKGVVGDWPNYLEEPDLRWLQSQQYWRSFFEEHDYDWQVPTVKGVLDTMSARGIRESHFHDAGDLPRVLTVVDLARDDDPVDAEPLAEAARAAGFEPRVLVTAAEVSPGAVTAYRERFGGQVEVYFELPWQDLPQVEPTARAVTEAVERLAAAGLETQAVVLRERRPAPAERVNEIVVALEEAGVTSRVLSAHRQLGPLIETRHGTLKASRAGGAFDPIDPRSYLGILQVNDLRLLVFAAGTDPTQPLNRGFDLDRIW